jgi:predicted component of type VI protein secretion system
MHIWAGPPVELDDLRGQPITKELLDEATRRVMADITGLLERIRGEQAPLERFDPVSAGLPEYGVPPAMTGGRNGSVDAVPVDQPRGATDQHREPA